MRDKRQHFLNDKVGQHLDYTKLAIPDARSCRPAPLKFLPFILPPPRPWMLSRYDSPLIACHIATKLYFFYSAQILRVKDVVKNWSGLNESVLTGHQACPWACAVTCLPMQNLCIPSFCRTEHTKATMTERGGWRFCHNTSAGLWLRGQSLCLFLCFRKECRINVLLLLFLFGWPFRPDRLGSKW